ncbi:MAG: FAD-dependent monooxygenase, partial [Pseudomonadota bacterium]
RDRLAEMPNVAITLGCEFIAIEQDDAGVTCIVKHDGKLETIHSKFAVGCDGGRSLTRRYLDIQLEDLGFDEPWVVVDVKVPEGYAGLSENGIQMCDPDRPTTCVPSGPGRHRWEFMLKPGETAEQVLRPESLRAWISTWINPDDVELERSAVYNFHGLVAKQWRKGRVMIIGDAAHQTPPFMGQGMCAGLRDAANLAWKLAMVHRGDAPDTLLDSLERERRPHAKAVIQGAIDMGKIVCVLDPAKAAARDRKMIADREAGKPFVLPDVPQIENGVLPDEIGGKVLPEGLTGDPGAPTRIDDICGYVPLLILKNAASSTSPFVHDMLSSTPLLRIAALNGTAEGCIPILDPDNIMSEMLGSDQAMLAKPDRIVFGKGGLQMLADKWQAYLTGTSFDSSQTVDAA